MEEAKLPFIKSIIKDAVRHLGFFAETQKTLIGVVDMLRGKDIEQIYAFYLSPEDLDFGGLGTFLDSLSNSLGLHRYTLNLLALIIYTPNLRENYRRKGISQEIAENTIRDIYYKYKECMQIYGIHGIYAWDWYEHILSLKTLAFGRLQFEDLTFRLDRYQDGENIVKKGDRVLSVHIPNTGTPLNYAECQASYLQAKEFYQQSFGDKAIPFVCWSWLLYPKHTDILPKTSNILRFMEDFDIIDAEEYEDFNAITERIFGKKHIENVMELPELTSLQRAVKKHLLSGGKMGWGYGIFFM